MKKEDVKFNAKPTKLLSLYLLKKSKVKCLRKFTFTGNAILRTFNMNKELPLTKLRVIDISLMGFFHVASRLVGLLQILQVLWSDTHWRFEGVQGPGAEINSGILVRKLV